jgi:HlyD family secretion protein
MVKEHAGAETVQPETATLRTATIATGDIERTIRLSGIVSAERFVALMAPRLRGIRTISGSYGGGGAKSLATSGGSSSASSSSSTSSSSSSSSASASGSTSQDASASSTNTALNATAATAGAPGAPASSLGAIRGTQNRFGDRTASQAASTSASASSLASSSSTGAAGSTTASTALGSNGLGSTSSSLLGTGGSSGGTVGGTSNAAGDSDFGLILMKIAEPGSHVKKGEVVAEFDRQYQLNRLDDYKATVVQLEANIKRQHADLAVAKKAHDQLVESAKGDWDKALLDLKTAEVRSAIEAEDLKLAAQEAEARYKQLVEEAKLLEVSQRADLMASEIDRNQAKIELERATLNVDQMVVRAPMDGIAVMQTIWRGGEYGQVQQGDQIWPGQTFMQIVDPTSMVLATNLNQVDAESMRLGLRATVRLDAYPGAEFRARVIGVGAMSKAGAWRPNYLRAIPVRLKLEQIDARVLPDLSASADIVLAAEQHATLAPLSAVFRDGAPKPFVFLRTATGWQRHEIEVGVRNHVAVAVRSGVSPGDVVAAEEPATGKAPS